MNWTGRNDGNAPLEQRLFQKVILEKNYENITDGDFVLKGFAVDEGVKRNHGKIGAAKGPNVIRKNLSNFPVTLANFRLLDFGNIYCDDQDLRSAQNNLAEHVYHVLSKNAKSIVLGGGHEVMFAHYSGIRKAYPNSKIGIINIDAHFDNRDLKPEIGPTSGTGFYQIAEAETINSLHIGIQRNSNTLKLFDYAHQKGMKYILAEELFFENLPSVYEKIDSLVAEVDVVYLTICMDVFNVAIAPGVSAAAYNGIFADATFLHLYKHILNNDKLIALDVAEVNPELDLQERTARLAGSLINEWFLIDQSC